MECPGESLAIAIFQNKSSTVGDFCDHTAVCPQFGSVGSVIGSEKEGVTNCDEVVEITATTSAVDVLDHHRS